MTANILDRLTAPIERARAWATIESRSGGRAKRLLAKSVLVVLLVARWEVVSRLQLHAQSLTYDTLLALVPLLAVVFAAVSGFGGLEEMRDRLETLILENIAAAPEVQATVSGYIHDFVGNIRTGSFSAISIVILIFSVMSLLGHIESAMNTVFGVKSLRPFVGRMLTYWASLTLGPLLLGASFALTAAFQSSFVAGGLEAMGVARILVHLVPLVVTWIAFAALYLLVPNTKVRPTAAIFAAVVAGTLWSLAKSGYAIYAKNALTVQNIYGSLATIPLFILWIYLSWLLVLLGAQLAFAYQHASTYSKEEAAETPSAAYRERVACRALLEVVRGFYFGAPPLEPDQLNERLGVPRRLIEAVLVDLKAGGYLREVEGGGLVPARDPGTISLADVLGYMRTQVGVHLGMTSDAGSAELEPHFKELDKKLHDLADPVSFRTLATQSGDPTVAPTPAS